MLCKPPFSLQNTISRAHSHTSCPLPSFTLHSGATHLPAHLPRSVLLLPYLTLSHVISSIRLIVMRLDIALSFTLYLYDQLPPTPNHTDSRSRFFVSLGNAALSCCHVSCQAQPAHWWEGNETPIKALEKADASFTKAKRSCRDPITRSVAACRIRGGLSGCAGWRRASGAEMPARGQRPSEPCPGRAGGGQPATCSTLAGENSRLRVRGLSDDGKQTDRASASRAAVCTPGSGG